MTTEQWLFEYKGLHAKEVSEVEREAELSRQRLRALRDTLIGVLGLNILGEKSKLEREKDAEEGFDPEMPKFVPASILLGQPEVLKHFMDQAKRRQAEDEAATDEAFDAFSEQLLQQLTKGGSDLPADMVPLLTEDLKDLERNSYWNSEEAQAAMRSLGIKPRVGGPAVPHVEKRPKYLEDRAAGGFYSDAELEMMGERSGRRRVDLEIDREAELEKFKRALAGEEESEPSG